jgi:preprotein translocase subunit SecA
MKNFIENIKNENQKLTLETNEQLTERIEKIKKQVLVENLDNVIVDWFAIVQEISYRTLGLKHFDTQLLGGLLLHQGKIVEMKTGEGKTLASTLPIALNALSKKGVHVVTVNEYLAERDQKWMGKIYKELDLTVGLIKSNNTTNQKRKSYNSDITYVTNSELVFDYLRDSSAYNQNEVVQRPFNYCIIDEIDSVLIDEARTPLILSTSENNNNINKLYLAKSIANSLEKDIHFQLDEKRREINLTEVGYKEAKTKLGKKTLYDPDDPWILEVLNALKAKYVFKLNKDYIVLNNKVVIVDEFTGRIMEDRRWSLGIHEAVEIK